MRKQGLPWAGGRAGGADVGQLDRGAQRTWTSSWASMFFEQGQITQPATQTAQNAPRSSQPWRRRSQPLAWNGPGPQFQPGTEALMQVHAGIERAWQIRAEAYAQAAEAWKDGELQSFTRAQNDNHAVSAAEERYIEAANTILAEYQLRLDLYP